MSAAPGRGSRRPFPRALLAGDVDAAAAALLGALLVRETDEGRRSGRIVEVEAYGGPEDEASHARFSRSSRRASMAAAPGHAYVYLVYGMHTCLNVVAGPAGSPAAVLIRAVAPLEGTALMRAARTARVGSGARATGPSTRARVADHRLASGPALVAAAFGIERSLDGADLCDPHAPLRLEVDQEGAAAGGEARIERGPRIGVQYAGEPWRSLPRRFFLRGEPAVSRPRPAGR